MQRILLQLSVPVYLKKILDRKYGKEYQAHESSLLGMTVLHTLQRKSDRSYHYSRNRDIDGHFRFKKNTELFYIYVHLDKAMRNGFTFTEKGAYRIVKALDRQIRQDLYATAIFNKQHYEIEYQTTIRDFLEFNDITEDDLSYESIRKDFNRNRRKIINQLNINV